MDENAIKELANQLGITVDKLWSYAPKYAEGCILHDAMIIIVCAILVEILFILSKKFYEKYKIAYELDDSNEVLWFTITVVAVALLSIFILVFIILLIVLIPDIILCHYNPEIALFNKLIK